MILYLHGFTSGPQSQKSQALGARMRERGMGDSFLAPQLPAARFDAYGRLTVMPQRTDPVKDLRYGGHMIDLGLTMTLGWR